MNTLIWIVGTVCFLAGLNFAARRIAQTARRTPAPGFWLRFLETGRAYLADEEPLLGLPAKTKGERP